MSDVVRKLGFLVHTPLLYDHWRNIWEQLDNSEFALLFTGMMLRPENGPARSAVEKMTQKVSAKKYRVENVDDLIRRRIRYEYVVSNHKVSGRSMEGKLPVAERGKNVLRRLLGRPPARTNQYISLRCGIRPVRIMYGADISGGWSLAQWNEQYQYVLCHGPNDEDAIRSRFSAKTFQIGYPRYDEYFNNPIPREDNPLWAEFGLDRGRKTLVWLPTAGEGACSLPHYAEQIAELTDTFNVIVRPHPITVREKPDVIATLEALSLNIDREVIRDMNELYALADYVVCDYGGIAFSALYLDKNILQLDVPGSEEFYTTAGSTNMELRELLEPVVAVDEGAEIRGLLNDNALWENQREQRSVAFGKYFAPYRGSSTEKVVEVLRGLLHS